MVATGKLASDHYSQGSDPLVGPLITSHSHNNKVVHLLNNVKNPYMLCLNSLQSNSCKLNRLIYIFDSIF